MPLSRLALAAACLAALGPPPAAAAPVPKAAGKEVTNSVGMRLALVPKGSFVMGLPKGEPVLYGNEPPHEVEITRPFYLGVHEVTQAQYEKVTGRNPSDHAKGGKRAAKVAGLDTADFPADSLSWDQAADFCAALSALPDEKKAGRSYRLPTEAEWEYACRAGTTTRYAFGDALTVADANCSGRFTTGDDPKGGDPLGRPCPVGSYKPNAWGLYDTHGNVWEWCQDWYQPDYYKVSPKADPPGPAEGSAGRRVRRGGDFGHVTLHLRSGARFPYQNDTFATGVRVACAAAGE